MAKKNYSPKDQKPNKIIKCDKRHLKFVKWWLLIKKNPDLIKDIREFEKGIRPDKITGLRHVAYIDLGSESPVYFGISTGYFEFKMNEIQPFINFYETHYKAVLKLKSYPNIEKLLAGKKADYTKAAIELDSIIENASYSEINNLMALVKGFDMNLYQRSLAKQEYLKVIKRA